MTGVDEALDRLEAFLDHSTEYNTGWSEGHRALAVQALATVRQRLAEQDTEIQRLTELNAGLTRDFNGMLVEQSKQRNRAEAAEAENRRLTEGLRDLESAVRILEVMLREPAAEGLMSAEDYRAYLSGAWLGVDEAVEKARALLAASPSGGGGA